MIIVCCPKCREEVTVPTDVNRSVQVGCPLCREEYALAAALEQLPPRLIVLGHVVGDDDESFLPVGASARGEMEAISGRIHGESSRMHREGAEWGPEPTPLAYAFKEPPVSMVRTAAHAAARTRARRRQGHPVRFFLHVVGGGILGLTLAQLILWWIPWMEGPSRDPFRLAQYVQYIPLLNRLIPDPVRASIVQVSLDTGQTSNTNATTNSGKVSDQSSPGTSTKDNGADEKSKSEKVESAAAETSNADPSRVQPAATPSGIGEPALVNAPPDAKSGTSSRPAESDVTITVNRVIPDPPRPNPSTASFPSKPSGRLIKYIPSLDPTEANFRMSQFEKADLAWDEQPAEATKEVRKQLFIDLYDALAQLGDAFAIADPADRSYESQLAALKTKLEILSQQPEKPQLMGVYSAIWLDRKDRDHNGIAIYGTVLSRERHGQVVESRVKLESRDQREIAVVTPLNLEPQLPLGHGVLILGRIVANPQQNVFGYVGSSAQVIVPGVDLELLPPAAGTAQK